MIGAPDCGKSTFLRHLSVNLVRGTPFLGKNTRKSRVAFLAPQEDEGMILDQIKLFNLTDEEESNFLWRFSPLPKGEKINKALINQLTRMILSNKPDLLILDTLFDFIEIPDGDGNNYNKVKPEVIIIRDICKDMGVHVICVHHQTKSGDKASVSSGIGSHAITGEFQTKLILNKNETGPELIIRGKYTTTPSMKLRFNPTDRTFEHLRNLAGAQAEFESQILAAVERAGELGTYKDALFRVMGGNKNDLYAAFDALAMSGALEESGKKLPGKNKAILYRINKNFDPTIRIF